MGTRHARWLGLWPAICCLAGLADSALPACSRSSLIAPTPSYPCLSIDPRGASSKIASADVQLVRSDVLFLVDNSDSMSEEINRIREQLRDALAPEIRARLPDSDLGLAVFSDFGEHTLGTPSHPYLLLQQITDDIDEVRAATQRIQLEYGGDDPESQLEALYQAATGKGYGSYIKAKTDCPVGTHGGACFRDGAFAIILLFTDAPMRNVTGLLPDGSLAPDDPFDPFAPDVPYIPYVRTYDETIAALRAARIHVLGLWSGGDEGLDDMRRVTHDTGGVDAAGQPIVFDIGGDGKALGQGVVQTIETLTSAIRVDVKLVLLDGNPDDGLDPRSLVTSVRALRAEPAEGGQPDGERFVGVSTGTRVFFEVSFDTSSLPASDVDQRYPLGLRVEADDGTLLSEQTVDLMAGAQSQCTTPQPVAPP
jgi:hypothetical protein